VTYAPGGTASGHIVQGEQRRDYGFAGLVGAGRSELAQAIFGVDPAVGGGILLEDKPVKVHAPKDAIGNESI